MFLLTTSQQDLSTSKQFWPKKQSTLKLNIVVLSYIGSSYHDLYINYSTIQYNTILYIVYCTVL